MTGTQPREQLVQWLRHGQPIPDGWQLAPHQTVNHHTVYGVLIVRVKE